MGAMAESRRHHYFPQFHLEYWAGADGKVCTYDRAAIFKPNPKRIAPINIGLEAHLYSDDHPEEPLEGVEEWLAAVVDGPASSAVAKVVGAQPISTTDREDIARYIMSRDLRVPRTRDFLMTLGQRELDAWRDGVIRDPESFREAVIADGGPPLDPAEVQASMAAMSVRLQRGFWLRFLQEHCIAATPRLLGYGWTLIHADKDCAFITSDLGSVKHRGSFANIVPHDLGWANNDGGWLIPLTPKLVLAIAPGLLPSPKLAQRPFVDHLNGALLGQAGRFAFADSEEELARATVASTGAS